MAFSHESAPYRHLEDAPIEPGILEIQQTLRDVSQKLRAGGDESVVAVWRNGVDNPSGKIWYGLFHSENSVGAYRGVKVEKIDDTWDVSLTNGNSWMPLRSFADAAQKFKDSPAVLRLFFHPGWDDRPLTEKVQFALSFRFPRMHTFAYRDSDGDEHTADLADVLREKRLVTEIPENEIQS